MHSFTVTSAQLIRSFTFHQKFNYKHHWLLTCLFLFLLNIGYAQSDTSVLRQPRIRENRFADSVSDRIKDSLKIELEHVKLNDPVTEKRFLTTLLKEEQATPTGTHRKKHGQKFYYKLAVAFTKLRLYPLAMKCYFKTLAIENKPDTIKYAPLVTASVDGRQLMAGNFNHRRDTLIYEDSIAARIMAIHNTDISLITKDSTSYNGDAEIKSPPLQGNQIIDPFDDGKKAVAYALMIHVRQPVSGKRKVYVLNNVGHTFITLIKYNADSTDVTRSFGFYPKKSFPLAATPLFPSSRSTFKDDSRHSWDEVSGTFISRKSFNKILTIVKKYDHKKYQLSHTNCTDFGLELAAEAGITITDTQGKWPLGKGNNPACTGQSILEGKITAVNDTYSGKLLVVDDLINTKSLTHYHK